MSEDTKIVLYQEWPGRRYGKYGTVDTTEPTKMISVFPATPEGLNEAISKTERPDAVLVKIAKNCDRAQRLIDIVEGKIKHGAFVSVFKPVNRMPRR